MVTHAPGIEAQSRLVWSMDKPQLAAALDHLAPVGVAALIQNRERRNRRILGDLSFDHFSAILQFCGPKQRYYRLALANSFPDVGSNLLIGQMLERFGRHDEQGFPFVADPLTDRSCKLLIGRMRRNAGQVRRPDCADIGLVEHLIAAQAFAMTAETAEHMRLAVSLGELSGRRLGQMFRLCRGTGVERGFRE
jgi:hypothetical protein